MHFLDESFLALAATEAEKYVGSTAPNPPVGAVLVKDGLLLGLGAHIRAGTPHAEIVAMTAAFQKYGAESIRGATLYVTLEPCNHQGRAPPCTHAIIEAGITRVVFGARDPNPNVQGNGAAALKKAGIEVEERNTSDLCDRLIQPFRKLMATGYPWVVHKAAFRQTDESRQNWTMLPEKGEKTFTSEESLKLAHLERKKCDAILTGYQTVLEDEPLFSVRYVPDHIEKKKRWIAVLSQHSRVLPSAWVERQREAGFEMLSFHKLEEALAGLGKLGVLRVLVEAGPTLSQIVAQEGLWDERLFFFKTADGSDRMTREFRKT